MSVLKKIFSSGISETIDAIDKLVTSDKEREELKNEFTKIMLSYESELTTRHNSDMASDSWLSKSIRPLCVAFLTVSTMLLAYLTVFILPEQKTQTLLPWIDLLETLLITVYAFYFGSRGLEKVSAIRK